jgi:hypothetical protein
MTNYKLSEKNMKLIPWLTSAVLACAVLAAPAASAQTISTTTAKAAGTVGKPKPVAVKLGAQPKTGVTVKTVATGPEAVALAGIVSLTANFIPDQAGGQPSMAFLIDATNVSGTGADTGATYSAVTAQATSTRPFVPQDRIQVTMPFFPNSDFTQLRTMLLTLDVTTDPLTHVVTAVVSNIGDFVAE